MCVDQRFAIALTDNDEQADSRQILYAAPAIGADSGLVVCYTSGSGDPTQICTLDSDGDVVWFLGEDQPEETEEVTIATCLEGFAEFCGMNPQECAEWCETLFGAQCER
jgi:hypothetical protein